MNNCRALPQKNVLTIAFALLVLVGALPAQAIPPLEEIVMYEVNLRAFSQGGDFAGVEQRLDEIQALGANVLWLMPIHPIGQIELKGELGSPYSVQDYNAVSSEYGTLADLTSLVDEAHDRGMFVLMDWVANHTAWDHAWISSNPEWYTQNGNGEIVHPPGTNWTDVADLNYSSAAMRSAMISEMQYWVTDVGIDGFRADAADFVPYDFWQQAVPAVRNSTSRPLLMLAEGARNDHFAAGFDLTFGWNFYSAVKSVFNSATPATWLNSVNTSVQSQVPAGKSILRFTTNHDESAWDATPVELFGSLEASLAAYAAMMAYSTTPLIYNGQEIGWSENVPFFSQSPLDWTTGQDTLDWYTQLLDIRADQVALRAGSITDQSNNDVALLLREHNGEQVLVMVNTRDHFSQIQIPLAWQGLWYDQFSADAESLGATFSLDPYEVFILAAEPPNPAADFDDDGDVDGGDFLAWARGETTPGLYAPDLVDWQAQFGANSSNANALATVPEPSALLLLVLGGFFLQSGRCMRGYPLH